MAETAPETADVAIVGGGPAGLGAAIALRRQGVASVLLLEREGEAGGIPRQCAHPPYGLREFGRILTGPVYAARLRAEALRHGVAIATRHSVVALEPGGLLRVATPDGARTIRARRVVLATGAREASRAGRLLSGDRPLGIMNTATLQDCLTLQGIVPFRHPVIVGTELVALSALATCLRHGIRPTAMIEPGDRPVARWPLGLFPRLARTPLLTRTTLEEILGTGSVDRVRLATPAGPREIRCDGVLLTGGFLPEASLVRASHLLLDPATGGPVIDADGRCSDPAYFAAGNLRRPVETAGHCFREGRGTGACVARDLAEPGGPGAARLTLVPGQDIRWVVPQRVREGQRPGLDLRVERAARGWLTVRAEGRLLWRRPILSRPERRIRIPARALRGASGDAMVAVEP